MLLVAEFPIADPRRFLPTATGQIAIPGFLSMEEGKGFVRSFGQITLRRGVDRWAGEERYADAAGAIKFPDAMGTPKPGEAWSEPAWYFAFRRLLSDQRVVSRIEIGLAQRSQDWLRKHSSNDLIDAALATPVRVNATEDAVVQCTLGASREPLVRHYLASTTSHTVPPLVEPPQWWSVAGRPLLIMVTDQVSLDPPTEARKAPALEEDGIDLWFWDRKHGDHKFGIWLLRPDPDALPDTVRRLRIHLARLHVERECLRTVLRQVVTKRIDVEPGHPASDLLQRYLADQTKLLKREQREGFVQSELLETAYRLDDLVTEGDRASLLTQLAEIRPQVLQMIEDFTKPAPTPPVAEPDIRVMLFAADPDGTTRINLGKEAKTIRGALQHGRLSERFDLERRFSVSVKDLAGELQRYRPVVVHFSMHGTESGRLLLEAESGRVEDAGAEWVTRLFQLTKDHVRCVVLSACYSKRIADRIRQHIDCVVGTPGELGDPDAIRFSRGFYEAIGNGENLEKAMEWGLLAMDEIWTDTSRPQLVTRDGVAPDKIVLTA